MRNRFLLEQQTGGRIAGFESAAEPLFEGFDRTLTARCAHWATAYAGDPRARWPIFQLQRKRPCAAHALIGFAAMSFCYAPRRSTAF